MQKPEIKIKPIPKFKPKDINKYFYDEKTKETFYVYSETEEYITFGAVEGNSKPRSWDREKFNNNVACGIFKRIVKEKISDKALKQFRDICNTGHLGMRIGDPLSVKYVAVERGYKEIVEYIDKGKYLVVAHAYWENGFWGGGQIRVRY